jgi:hypothetical protein
MQLKITKEDGLTSSAFGSLDMIRKSKIIKTMAKMRKLDAEATTG